MPAPRESAALSALIEAALGEYARQYTEGIHNQTIATHHRRYHLLMAQVAALIDRDASVRILDIGPRFEVDLLHRLFPKATVDTLGLNVGLFAPREGEHNYVFDLSRADFVDERPVIGPYDVIVMAEVFEHISMPPSVFLPWLGSLLKRGAYLVIQTPNAVALPKRARMLAGRHPFWVLASDRAFPGHYREYTVSEMKAAVSASGLDVANVWTGNYFDSDKRSNRLYGRMERIVPSTLRAGITIVGQNRNNRANA